MLKIKDNVDLKELEKFGANFNNNTGKINIRHLVINMWNRKIYISPCNTLDQDEDVISLYDLIKADLVEKVEDK